MQSNSKLTKSAKALLKEMRADLPGVKFAIMGETTTAFKHVGDLVEFATANCAYNEKKNRPKVGKFWAIRRFASGKTVKLPKRQFEQMLDNEYDNAYNYF